MGGHHYGQGLAGCPLNSIAQCLLRHMAALFCPGRAMGSIRDSPCVVLVDDFTFY
jgi:hypothetical protein